MFGVERDGDGEPGPPGSATSARGGSEIDDELGSAACDDLAVRDGRAAET